MSIISKIVQRISSYIYTLYVLTVFVVTFFIQLPLFFIFSLFSGKIRYRLIFVLFKIWGHLFFFLIGITIRITGKEKISKNTKCVVVANHHSFLDTPMIYAALPFFVKPLARSDYGKIPLFGYLYRIAAIPVNRDSISSKKESFQKMLSAIREDGTNIFIFPEGSFNETDSILKPFFDGAFRIAKASGQPIVPVLFPDTIKRWHYSSFWSWRPGISRAYILDPIPAEVVARLEIKQLKELVYREMEMHLIHIDT